MRNHRPARYPDIEAGHFIHGVDMPMWRTLKRPDRPAPPRPDLLFHNPSDPDQEYDRAHDRSDIRDHLIKLLRDHALAVHAPEEQRRRLHVDAR
jgi:hypothetical protein